MATGPDITAWLRLQDEAERPFVTFGREVPDAAVDLDRAESALVAALGGPVETGSFDDFSVKARNLARAFDGQPKIALLNAKLMVLLRRRDPPPHAIELFHRLWRQKHDVLASLLSPRWLISTAHTLSDHGETEVQRRMGGEITVLFGMVKLHETERLFSAKRPHELFPPGRHTDRIALDLDSFALSGGDLDRVLITRIWRRADEDPVARAVAHPLLSALLDEERAIFHRLRRMQKRRRADSQGD